MKREKYWQPVVERFSKKLATWKGRHLSFAGRVTLAKAVLGSLPSYYLSLFPAPKGILKKLEGIRRDFVWGKNGRFNKIRWIRWDKMVAPKMKGGVGIGSIEDYNTAMLTKWWWRLKNEPNQLWDAVVRSIHKNTIDKMIIPVKKAVPGAWKDIAGMDKAMAQYDIQINDKLKVVVRDGSKVRFWKDRWLLSDPLSSVFPDLYKLERHKNILVQGRFEVKAGWVFEWSRPLASSAEHTQFGKLSDHLANISLSGAPDYWVWVNQGGCNFSVKDLRLQIQLQKCSSQNASRFVWNLWPPLKGRGEQN